MNPKDTHQEYVMLRAAAMMFLKAEAEYYEKMEGYRDGGASMAECRHAGTRLDAARSVLWDVINDKDLTKQS